MKLKELFQQMENVRKKIGVEPFFACGGVPRDKYMKRLDNVSDIDITNGNKSITYLSQEFAIDLKKKYNITYKTMDDGHSSIFIGNLKLDFSSNFIIPNIDNYLKDLKINNPTNLQREVFSRDFTCNSLLLTIDLNKILDPTSRGFTDINEKKIRTCLNPAITLTSNRNRVVRAIYLACKLDFDIDQSIIDYVVKNPEVVKISTDKSMNEKLNEAFAKNPNKAALLITKMNLWNHIPITESAYPYYQQYLKGNNVSK